MIFDHTVNVSRLLPDSTNTNKESYASYAPLQNIACNIQPSAPEDVVMADGVFGQTYTCFTTASGILEGDLLTVELTNEMFRVKGKTNWMGSSLIPHIELLLVQFEQEK